MRATWLIEADVYRDEAAPLLDEIHRQGLAGATVPYQVLKKGSITDLGSEPVSPEACVIGHGTFPFAQEILLHSRWFPALGAPLRTLIARRTMLTSAGSS
jgi:hypothetical protein